MKKIILLITTVLACFMSSCSNEDIDVNFAGGLTVNVSTQNAYDEIGMLQSYKESLLSKGYKLGVYNYFYNKEGKLAASDSAYVSTFDMVPMKFDLLPQGSYTLITLEMIVDPDDKNKSDYWTIVGQEDITTIEIKSKYNTVYSDGVVGLGSKEITVNGGDTQTVSIQPKAIGSIVNLLYVNFESSPYNRLAFYTKDTPAGRFLSPYKTGKDRFEDDEYNASRTWSTRGYVYKRAGLDQNEELNIYLIEDGTVRYCYGPSEVTDESAQITFTAYPSNEADYQFSDGKNYYGGLWYTGGNPACESSLFPTANELFAWMEQMSNLTENILAPYLKWGNNSSSVDTYMISNGAKLVNSGLNQEDDIYWTYYMNSDSSISYEYQFAANKTNLSATFMNFYTKNLNQVRDYLKESFEGGEYNEELDGYLYYSSDTVLLASESDDQKYVTVLFVPNTTYVNPQKVKRSIPIDLIKSVRKFTE